MSTSDRPARLSGRPAGKAPPGGGALRLRFDAFELDEANARLTRDGQAVALAPKALAVLCALARQPGQLVGKDALLDAVWGHLHVSESVLKTIVSELRAALQDDARQPRYIQTAARHGYRFIASVETMAAAALAAAAPAAAPMTPAPMVGRQAALAKMHEAWRDAAGGRRRIVWITGEPGIGKTTLIERFTAGIEAAAVASGQCIGEFGAGEPYVPVLEALGTLCRRQPDRVPLLRAVAPTWLLQLPWLSNDAEREALQRALVGASQDRMLREFGELLDRLTQDRPLLLVTEDLHWGDHATVRLLDHVARRRSPARLLWLASFRLAEVIAGDHPLKSLRNELRLHRLSEEILLEPFSETELGQYVGSRLGPHGASEDLVRALHARTEGLPLFVASIVEELDRHGSAGVGDGAAASRRLPLLDVPESLAGIIEGQFERLAPEQQALLEAASVCGVEFHPSTVAAALERDAESVADGCEALARRHAWLAEAAADRRGGHPADVRYAFRHALYQQVLYRRPGAAARARLHRRVGQAMERMRADGIAVAPAELASHYDRGQDLSAALRHYTEAALLALRHFAATEALQLTDRAIELLPGIAPPAQRQALEAAVLRPRVIALQQLLGVASPRTRAAFERILELAGQMPDGSAQGLELGLGWVYYVQGEYGRALALARGIDEAAQARGNAVLQVAACNLLGAVVLAQGDLPSARHWLQRGIDGFAQVEGALRQAPLVVDLDVAMRARLCQALSHLGYAQLAQQQIDIAMARAESLDHPLARQLALAYAALLQVRLERADRAHELAAALLRHCEQHTMAEIEGPALCLLGWSTARLGQAEQGAALLQRGFELQLKKGNLGGGTVSFYGFAAEGWLRAGRLAQARVALEEGLALAARIGEGLFLPDLLLLQGRLQLAEGHTAEARASMRQSLDVAAGQQALWLQAGALVALCELPAPSPQDLDALRSVRSRLTEGAGTPLMQRADALLGEQAGAAPAASGPHGSPRPDPDRNRTVS